MKRGTLIIVLLMSATAGGQTIGESGAQLAPGEAWQPQVDEYVVEEGDTLWDISERVLGDAFQWTKVWSFNPEITNPHWIYPGDMIRFYKPDLELPSQYDLVSANMPLPPDTELIGEGDSEEEVPDTMPAIEVVNQMPTEGARARKRRKRLVSMFVTVDELSEAGRLTNARPDKILLGTGDEVFFTPSAGGKFERGSKVIFFRTIGDVSHPLTNDDWGYMTQVTGTAEVLTATKLDGEDVVRARIGELLYEIERGQFVAPLTPEMYEDLTVKPTKKRIEGYVLAVRDLIGRYAGTQEYVFIDKGTSDGIETGNELFVLRRGDPVTDEEEGTTYTRIGVLQVVETKENASTCMVMRAQREIARGSKVITATQ